MGLITAFAGVWLTVIVATLLGNGTWQAPDVTSRLYEVVLVMVGGS